MEVYEKPVQEDGQQKRLPQDTMSTSTSFLLHQHTVYSMLTKKCKEMLFGEKLRNMF